MFSPMPSPLPLLTAHHVLREVRLVCQGCPVVSWASIVRFKQRRL
jgi:hypothetical protein